MKRYINYSIIYSLCAIVGAVFYREFTKFNGFTGKTTLTVVHTHYFLLGMVFFLIMLLLEKNFKFSNKKTGKLLVAYHIGINATVIMLIVRGIIQVLNIPLTKVTSAAVSGVAGIGHIILGVSIVMLLLEVKKSVK